MGIITIDDNDNYLHDKHGFDMKHYEKLFPIGEYFLYVSKYGGKTKIESRGISVHTNIDWGFSSYSVRGTHAIYNIEECVSLNRNKKLKRLLTKIF